MKSLYFAAVFFFAVFGISGQNPALFQENLKDFELAGNDSLRCAYLAQASFNSAHSNSQKGIQLGYQALTLARQLESKKLEADSHNSLGICFDSQGETDSAMYHYNASIKLFKETDDICTLAKSYSNIGNLQRKKAFITDALTSYAKAIEIATKCGDEEITGALLYAIGACYNAMREFEKALEYFDNALINAKKFDDASSICNIYNGKANAYIGLNELETSAQYFKLAIQCMKDTKNEYNLAYCFESLAFLQKALGNPDSTIYYSGLALEVFERLGAVIDIAYEKSLLAEFLINAGQFKKADSLMYDALSMSYEAEFPREREKIFALFALSFEKQGKFREAYFNYKEAIALRDSLNLDKQNEELTRLANKFETDKRDRQIAEEKALVLRHQLESEKQKQQKYLFMIAVIVLCFISVVLVYRYLNKQRTAKKLQEKNEIIAMEKEKAERSERQKQLFLSKMSHEIRTPVNAINGLSRLLLSKAYDQQTHDYLKAINHSGENLLVVLNDVLDLAKMEAGKMSIAKLPFLLKEEIKNTALIFSERASDKGLQLEVKLSDKLPEIVEGDAVRLSQVLSNLISNAIKFTNNGAVIVSAEKLGKEGIIFRVKDTGMGIDEKERELIFDNFTQAESGTQPKGGTGLGLPIAKNLVELMGGSLTLESSMESGSLFSFVLSLPQSTLGEIPVSENKIQVSNMDLHIIVAEDVEYNFWVTEQVLKKYFPESTVYRALNGHEVINLLEEDEYDLIMMDLQMPELNGIETTKRIRLLNYYIPVIGLTANVMHEINVEAIDAGMAKIIAKPFKDADLIHAIHAVLKLNPEKELIEDAKEDLALVSKSMFLLWMPGHIENLNQAMFLRDMKSISALVHKMRPQLIQSGCVGSDSDLLLAEQQTEWNDKLEATLQNLIREIEYKLNLYRIV